VSLYPSRGEGTVERHAKRENHYADCEQMQIICAAILELLSAPRDPLFNQEPRPSAALSAGGR
jgi:hypothetical protein